HLRGIGFSAALDGLMARTGSSKWTLPAAGLAQAEEGLLHVMGVLRERNEVRAEIDEAALRLQQTLNAEAPRSDQGGTDQGGSGQGETDEARAIEDWERLRSQQNNVLEGESRRSDLDRDDPVGLVKGGMINS